ncbi:ABATE domain-containing protein [Nonomuraea sp. B1E8]|uniref:CGNR zinc finger domain-containing protein n=1 Tax=unclassified Nonomuraea TaxID=2593643 RepID=UPI00325E563F
MAATDYWIRDGGRVCLDLVNTLRDRWSSPRDTLAAPSDLVRWLHGAGLLTTRRLPDPAGATLRSARLLREAIDRAVLSAAGGRLPDLGDIEVINEAVTAAPRPLPQLTIADGRLASGDTGAPVNDVSAALGLVARDAIELLLSSKVRRVRVCASDRCALRFLDQSQGGRRRWCSMSRCGNRVKAQRHHLRTRAPG